MPEFFNYNKLGGLNLDKSPRTLKPEESRVAKNLIISDRNARVRPGQVRISQFFIPSTEFIGMHPYHPNDGGPKALIIINTSGIFSYRS